MRVVLLITTLATACGQAPAEGGTEATSNMTAASSSPSSTTTDALPTETSTTTSTSGPEPTTSTGTSGPEPTTTTGSATISPSSTSTGDEPGVGCADLPLCDDFEGVVAGEAPDPSLWTVTSPNCSGTGTLAVDDAVAHGGGQSLRVDGGGGYCDHVFVANSAAVAAIGPQVFGRVWLRLGDALGQGHVTFMTLRDSADSGGKDLRMGGQSQILMWNRESDDATLPALSPAGIALSVAPTPGQWTCVEFMIDGPAGALTTWVDGAEVAGLVIDGVPTPDVDQQWLSKPDWQPALADFKLGWESYAGQTMTLYFDDVALAGARIGCDG